jgi:2-iminobutanoate/2-iminopropanoate deaminase
MKALSLVAIVPLACVLPATAAEKKAGQASKVEVISTSDAAKSIGPFSQGVRAGGFIFCSGQGAFVPGQLVEGGIKEQTRQVLRNIQAVVEGGGSSLDRVVKVTV